MRHLPLLLSLSALSTPALAAEPAKPKAAPPAAAAPDMPPPGEVAEVQKVLGDPANGEKMARMGSVLTRVMMDLPIGELEAAIDGRPVTKADRSRTVRDGIGGPAEAARIEREVAASGPRVQAMGAALSTSLPAILSAMTSVAGALDKAADAMPQDAKPAR